MTRSSPGCATSCGPPLRQLPATPISRRSRVTSGRTTASVPSAALVGSIHTSRAAGGGSTRPASSGITGAGLTSGASGTSATGISPAEATQAITTEAAASTAFLRSMASSSEAAPPSTSALTGARRSLHEETRCVRTPLRDLGEALCDLGMSREREGT